MAWGVHGKDRACMVVVGACMAGGMHDRGACVMGSMHGRGACVAGEHVWCRACMAGGMFGNGHAWQRACLAGGVHGGRACVSGGACMAGRHAWQEGMHAMHAPWQILRDTVNERAVRILWNAF